MVELDPPTVMLPATVDINPVSADRTDDTCIPNLQKYPLLLPLLSPHWFSERVAPKLLPSRHGPDRDA